MSIMAVQLGNGAACLCTGECHRTGICPNTLYGGPYKWPANVCICPCHNSIGYPYYPCYCGCKKSSSFNIEDYIRESNKKMSEEKFSNEKINEKFTNLEKLINDLHAKIVKLSENSQKRPFKCPICEGIGRQYIDPAKPLSGFEAMIAQKDERGVSFTICKPCEGKGILWG